MSLDKTFSSGEADSLAPPLLNVFTERMEFFLLGALHFCPSDRGKPVSICHQVAVFCMIKIKLN